MFEVFPSEIRLKGLDATREFARRMAEKLPHGSLVLLTGDVGAGKTTFVRAFAGFFGLADEVTSPTFTLMNEYAGSGVRICHFDLYRLHTAEDVEDIGALDFIAGADYAFVEWPEIGEPVFGKNAVRMRFSHGDAEDERVVRVEMP
jgi:tRNA threonylcarbamoyladenosine biosynthesis protein TsaE